SWATPVRLTSGPDLEVTPSLAVNKDGTFDLVYEHRVAPGATPGGPALDQPIGAPVSARVGTSHVRMLPELGFTTPLHVVASGFAPSGTEVLGQATSVNRGMAGTNVLVQYSREGTDKANLGSQVIYLGPGRSYDLAHAFPVVPGKQDFVVKLTAQDFSDEAV